MASRFLASSSCRLAISAILRSPVTHSVLVHAQPLAGLDGVTLGLQPGLQRRHVFGGVGVVVAAQLGHRP